MATTPVPTVTTDLLDYAPGSTAVLTASNFIIGSTLEFQVLHVTDPGSDGLYGTLDDVLGDNSGEGHEAWYVTDGVRTAGADGVVGTADDEGDLDGVADGNVVTNWYVNPDDSLGATFLLTATDETTGQAASSSFTDSAYFTDPLPTNPVDLTALGAEVTVTGSVGGAAIFSQFTFAAGSGVLDSFVRLQTNNAREDGYNTDFRTGPATEFDENTSSSFTHSLLLANVPIAFIGTTPYREFRLDINESSGANEYLSLDHLRIYLGTAGNLIDFDNDGDANDKTGAVNTYPAGNDFQANTQLVWDLGNNWIQLNGAHASGGGVGDVSVFIPDSAFTGKTGTFVYLYSSFGEQGDDDKGTQTNADDQNWTNSSGFEEWGRGIGRPIQASDLVGLKFDDFNQNGVQDPGEPGLGSVTVYLDIDNSNTLNTGDVSTTTSLALSDLNGDGVIDPIGSYSFNDLVAGLGAASTYTVREVVPADYIQTGPNNGSYLVGVAAETASVSGDGTADGAEIVIEIKTGLVTYNLPAFGNWSTIPPDGALTLSKEVSVDGGNTWFPADDPTGPIVDEGTPVHFQFVIESHDAQNYIDLGLTDSLFSPLALASKTGGDDDDILENNEIWTYTYGPVPAIVGQHTDTAKLEAVRVLPNGNTQDVTVTNDANYLGQDVAPLVSLDKTGETTINEGGDTATYTLTITNNSTVDAVTVTELTDDIFGDLLAEAVAANGGNPIVLAVGASFDFDIDRELDLNAGDTHTNTATVVVEDDDGTEATDDDPHTVTAQDVAPLVSLDKTGETTINEGGDTATYTLTITNNSTVDAVTVTELTDDIFGDLLAEAVAANGGNPIVLAVGGSFNFNIDRELDLNAGDTHTNTATVVVEDDDGTEATDDDPHTVTAQDVAPLVSLDKTGETTINEGGDTATYTLTITNNSTVDAVTVTELTDDIFGDLLAEAVAANGGNPIVLAVGGSFNFNIDRELDLNAGDTHTNTATVVVEDDDGTEATDDDPHTVTAQDVAPLVSLDKTGETTINEGGDTATYTLTITNNSTVDAVTVTELTDDIFGDLLAEAVAANGGNPIVLAVGASFDFDIDRELDLNAGDTHTNTATVVVEDDDGTEATDDDPHTVTAQDVAPLVSLDKTGETTINEGGDTATYTLTITNNSTVDAVTVTELTDDIFGDLLAEAVAANGGNPIVLAVGGSFNFNIDRELDLNAGDTHTNTATVVVEDDDGTEATDDDPHTVTAQDVAPLVSLDKTGETTINEGGDTATYTLTITNNSTVDAVTVTELTDDIFGDLLAEAVAANGGNPIVLAVGGSFNFNIDRELDLNAGDTHTNTATVVVEDDDGTEATDDDPHTVTAQDVAPLVSLDKTGETTINEGGDTATYTLTITNNSTVDAVTVTELTDDIFGDLLAEAVAANGGNPIVLAVGGSFNFNIDRELDLNAGDTHTNTATVVVEDDDGTEATDDDPHTVTAQDVAPLVSLDKTGETTINEGGDTATYTLTITNNSTVDAVTVTELTDDIFGDLLAEAVAANGGNPIVLAVGGSFNFNIDRELDLNAGDTHTNTATVVVEDDDGTEATDDDPHTVTAQDVAPLVSLDKTGETTINEGGDTATYTLTITNNSTVDAVTVTELTDDIFGDLLAEAVAANGGNPIVLAVGGSFNFNIDRELDLNAGDTHTNTATVVVEDDDGTEATDDDPHTVTAQDVAPLVSLDKTGETTINEGGDTATYTLTITNNSTVDAVTVTELTDDIFGDLLAEAVAANGGNPIVLAVGGSFNFNIDRELDLNAGDTHTNTATVVVEDDDGTEATDDDPHTVTAQDVAPLVSLDKTGETTINEGGDTATYTLTITNNSTVDAVTVTELTDDIFGDLLAEAVAANGGNPIVLAVGGSFNFNIDRELDLNAGDTHTNTATVVVEDDDGTEATDDDPHTVTAQDVAPLVSLDKTGETTINEGGDTATYTLTITNNSTVDAVTVTELTDDIFGDLLAEAVAANGGNPIVLAVGGSFNFNIDRELDLNAGDTHTNTATVVVEDDDGTEATDDDPHTVTAQDVAPAINIEKTVDADGDGNFVDFELLDVGDDLADYRYVLTNTSPAGAVDPLTIDSLVDDRGTPLNTSDDIELVVGGVLQGNVTLDKGLIDDLDNFLDVGETWTYTVEDVDLSSLGFGDTLTNTATVQATDDDGSEATADDDATVEHPVPPTFDVIGYKWNDLDHNGEWDDPAEQSLSGWKIFVDADGSGVVGQLDWTDDGVLNGVWDPGEGEQWTTTDGLGSYNLTLDTAGMAAGSYHVREVSQPGWIQSSNGSVEINIAGDGSFTLEFPNGVPLDPSTSGEFGNDGAYNFGNYSTPGVRTPGFWTNTKWQQYWNGNPTDQDSLPQTGQPNFPDGELLYAVDDPVEADLLPDDGPGLLIGDYNKNGLTDIGEETLFYTRAEALAIINSSTQTANQDARYILDRDVIATWLNFLNGNPIEEGTDTNLSDPPAVGSPQYYLDQAIDWLQYVTPNEGGVDSQGDGKLAGTTRVPSSSTFWNQGISNNSDGNPLNNYPGGGYNNPFDGPVLAGNNIHNALNEYNSSGTINGVFYAWDGDSVF